MENGKCMELNANKFHWIAGVWVGASNFRSNFSLSAFTLERNFLN